MGSLYDSTVELAEANLNQTICRATLTAMTAVTIAPETSAVIENQRQILAEASMDLEAAKYHMEFAEEEERDLRQAEYKATFDKSHTFLQALLSGLSDIDRCTLATDQIKQYISDSHAAEYGYSDTVNPEGVSQGILNEKEERSQHLMLASLSLLDDHEIVRVLNEAKAWDHDGSTFLVSSVERVREWQARYQNKSIADTLSGEADAGSLLVKFSSVWEEGIITTYALLDLQTGKVANIGSSDQGDSFEHLRYEEIKDPNRGISAAVVADDENQYFLEDLSMLAQFGGAEITATARPRERG